MIKITDDEQCEVWVSKTHIVSVRFFQDYDERTGTKIPYCAITTTNGYLRTCQFEDFDLIRKTLLK